MKATLEFELDDPDHQMAHLRCVKSLDLALCLCDISEMVCKLANGKLVNPKKMSKEELLTFLNDQVHQVLDKRGIVLDDLVC